MYFPYLRGRQFELLAIRELVEKGLLSKKIIPVIEPVKLTPGLVKTLVAFNKNDSKVAFIINPLVGSFSLQQDENDLMNVLKDQLLNNNIIKGYLFNKQNLLDIKYPISDSLAFILDRDSVNLYSEIVGAENPQYTLIEDNRIYKRTVTNNRVVIEDCFNRQDRNSDYLNLEDEFFSDWHLCYDEEGYIGFADYSVVGAYYSESGFAPLAVAIHIVYTDSDNKLRIHHFVSDSNGNIQDTAGKFGEAAKKLREWYDTHRSVETEGLRALIDYYDTGRYPGLGVVKKYSIMHHLELMSKILGD